MSDLARLRQVLAELSMVSQAPAMRLDRTGRDTSTSVGGSRPSGGIDHRADREPDHRQKSAAHFARRVRLGMSQQDIAALVQEAQEALDAWRRTPIPAGQDPEFSSPQWKRWVAESTLSAGEIARKYGCTRQYVSRIRRDYESVRPAR